MSLELAISLGVRGTRIFVISDFAVTIWTHHKMILVKGTHLPCRKLGALCIAHDVKALLIHVRPENNPANGPSHFTRPELEATNISNDRRTVAQLTNRRSCGENSY